MRLEEKKVVLLKCRVGLLVVVVNDARACRSFEFNIFWIGL